MKNILVEITDYGAIIHKDTSVIEAKKSLPNCVLNPDLSLVAGVSPSYWVMNDNKQIVPATKEQTLKVDDYHKTSIENISNTLGSVAPQVKEEIYLDFEESIKELEDSIQEVKDNNKMSLLNISMDLSSALAFIDKATKDADEKIASVKKECMETVKDIKSVTDQIVNTLDVKSISLKNDIDEVKKEIADIEQAITEMKQHITSIEDVSVSSKNDIVSTIKDLSSSVDVLKEKDDSKLLQKVDNNLKSLEEKIEDNKKHCEIISDLIGINLSKQEKQIKYLKLFLIGTVILTIILRVI